MASFGVDTRPAAAASGRGGGGSGGSGGTGTGEGALSFLSRGIREDLRLIRARAGELETFLNAPVPEPELFARLRQAYSSSSARTKLDLSAIGKAFEAESWRGARGSARWRWEQEEAEEWEPIRTVKARLRELERRTQGQTASDMLHKVKLSLVSFPQTWKQFTASNL
jgi:digalactosyldiacylglycerol synthase